MPREMRFCRLCGCRLGEGVEEYTETVRLQNAPQTAKSRKTKTASARTAQSKGFKDLNAMAAGISHETVKSVTTGLERWKVGRACKRVPRWMIWVFLPLFVMGMLNGLFSPSEIRRRARNRDSVSSSSGGAYLGGEYRTAEGNTGALLKRVTPPGSAADKAGLVGGDLIISFDGKPVKGQDELNDLLAQTPVGKSVDVVYVRDGETRTVKLTTISESENQRLASEFSDRPAGRGRMGFDDDDTEIVKIPGTNISGVRLDDISPNLPADMAGVKEGDVVIQLDNTPIRTVEELVGRIQRAVPYSTINLVVMRGTERLEIPVKVGRQ